MDKTYVKEELISPYGFPHHNRGNIGCACYLSHHLGWTLDNSLTFDFFIIILILFLGGKHTRAKAISSCLLFSLLSSVFRSFSGEYPRDSIFHQ